MRYFYFKVIQMLPSWIKDNVPVDKLAHFVAGFFAAVPFVLIDQSIIGVIVAAVLGFGKEAVDQLKNNKAEKAGLPKPHSVEVMDAVVTTLGGLSVHILLDIGKSFF